MIGLSEHLSVIKNKERRIDLPFLHFVIFHYGSEVAALHLVLQHLQEKLVITALKVLQLGLHILLI